MLGAEQYAAAKFALASEQSRVTWATRMETGFFNYLFIFNKDFQIFLPILFWALPKQLKPSTLELFSFQKRLQHVNEQEFPDGTSRELK